MHQIRSEFFQHGRWRLGLQRVGNGGARVLLIHGLLLDSGINHDIAVALAGRGCEVALLDLLGHGRSDRPVDPTEYRIDFFAEQAIAALDHLGWDRAAIGGVSLGAITALHAAVREPNRVRALLLEMPVMEHATPAAALMLTPLLLASRSAAGLLRPAARLVARLPRPRHALAASLLDAASRDPELTSAILHGILVGPVVPPAAERRRIRAPALIVGHRHDLLHPMDDAAALAREMPQAELLQARSIIELRLRPKRLLPRIADFLLRHAGSGVPQTETARPADGNGDDRGADDPQARFAAAVEMVRNAPPDGPFKPDNALKLKLYALYRQATDGDVQGPRPGITDPVGRLKHDAWARLRGMPREQAMREYADIVEDIARRVGGASASG